MGRYHIDRHSAKHLGVSANLTIYTVLICVPEEQKRTHANILQVINMLMTFEQLIFMWIQTFL